MTTSKTLMRMIAKQTDISKLQKLRDSGLQKMVSDSRIDDFTFENKTELIIVIDARIAELQA
jgi:hypothetical protein